MQTPGLDREALGPEFDVISSIAQELHRQEHRVRVGDVEENSGYPGLGGPPDCSRERVQEE